MSLEDDSEEVLRRIKRSSTKHGDGVIYGVFFINGGWEVANTKSVRARKLKNKPVAGYYTHDIPLESLHDDMQELVRILNEAA